ncbi:hypothetical protein RUND412_006493 [Rhizina undulata]
MSSPVTSTPTTPAVSKVGLPSPAGEPCIVTDPPASKKGRKGSAAGGGKAWTEDEEVYLLQMRLERVAYKKIASHLDKTELACRLHYHQLSHGGNRRKRNNSMSSTSSSSPVASPFSESPVDKVRSSTPNNFSPVNATGAIQKVGSSIAPKTKGKPLLPKPLDNSSSRKQTPAKVKKLRVNCCPENIDKERLIRIVEAAQDRFWETVANQYGGSIDPEYLQKYWQKGFTSTPPTPAISPASKTASPIAVDLAEENNGQNTMATVSEVSTPATSAMSPAAIGFSGQEVSIKDETMVDSPVELKEEEEEAPKCANPTETNGDAVMA